MAKTMKISDVELDKIQGGAMGSITVDMTEDTTNALATDHTGTLDSSDTSMTKKI